MYIQDKTKCYEIVGFTELFLSKIKLTNRKHFTLFRFHRTVLKQNENEQIINTLHCLGFTELFFSKMKLTNCKNPTEDEKRNELRRLPGFLKNCPKAIRNRNKIQRTLLVSSIMLCFNGLNFSLCSYIYT